MSKKIKAIASHFNVTKVEHWQTVCPDDVLKLDGIGPKTLDQLRLAIADHGLTLEDDETPAFWQTHLREAMTTGEEVCAVSPIRVLIDKGEQKPFDFRGIRGDDGTPLLIRTRSEYLGPSKGDYTASGLDGFCHIERKSKADCIGTILSYGDRAAAFVLELTYLSSVPAGFIIVEESLGDCYAALGDPTYPANRNTTKTPQERQRSFYRQLLAYQSRYSVRWIFCPNRRFAEITTFRLLELARRDKLRHEKGD